MIRTRAQIFAAMAAAGRLVPFDGSASWADALFAADVDGSPAPSPAGEPDRELLAALAAEYAQLDAHADGLPRRLHQAWLEGILGVERLPAVPDRVVAHVEVDPRQTPAVVPRGTLLRGGRDAYGNERRYATVDTLTAHGPALAGVRSLVPGGAGAGRPGTAASAPGFPLRPAEGPDAVHALRIHSPVLGFDGGDLTAALTFEGATDPAALAGVLWRYPQPGGAMGLSPGTVAGTTVLVPLTAGCAAPDGDGPWIEGVVPPHVPVPESFSFTGVSVRVAERAGVVPQEAYYNDGALDTSKEFQPFGAVAKRGDAFYLRSDEAFGKPLDSLRISVLLLRDRDGVLHASAGGSGIPGPVSAALVEQLAQIQVKLGSHFGLIEPVWTAAAASVKARGTPKVLWQRRVAGQWQKFAEAGGFASVSAPLAGAAASQRFALSGRQGHYMRAFLAEGDFGWTDYQRDVADFATQAVAKGTPKMPTLPVPPVASAITLSYTTAAVPALRVEARSGWRHREKPEAGAFAPFRRHVSESGATAMVAVGLELPDAALGSSVSLWLDVDPAAGCSGTGPGGGTGTAGTAWEWWDGTRWSALAVADGTLQLRQPGLLRFVAPHGWAEGCMDLSAGTGRWVRLATDRPELLGDLRAVVPDAVLAEFVSAAPDPRRDPSSGQALAPGTIKGMLATVPGVKKASNLAGVRGREPEATEPYLARASALVRHRGRALLPWDYEQHVALAFPEVAAVRCLPHTGPDGRRAPGSVGLVVVPDLPADPSPRPSASLAARIATTLAGVKPVGARLHVLCADYRAATVVAAIRLRPGVAALTGQQEVTAALERLLHPAAVLPVRWGRPLYASALAAFLERQPAVDVVASLELRDGAGAAVERVQVDGHRGLYCSGADHRIVFEEQL